MQLVKARILNLETKSIKGGAYLYGIQHLNSIWVGAPDNLEQLSFIEFPRAFEILHRQHGDKIWNVVVVVTTVNDVPFSFEENWVPRTPSLMLVSPHLQTKGDEVLSLLKIPTWKKFCCGQSQDIELICGEDFLSP